MKHWPVFCAAILWGAMPAACQASGEARPPERAAASQVRVGLFQKELPQTFSISSSGGLHILDQESGRPLTEVPRSEPAILEKVGRQVRVMIGSESTSYSRALRIEPQKPGSEIKITTPRIADRAFSGVLEVEARPRELLAVNIVSAEDYLGAVIAGELPRAWPQDAFKAQAVVARTYILKNRGRHHSDGYDFCDLAHCQVYKGRGMINPAVLKAVLQTEGEVLLFEGSPIEVFFHSVCGGHTASIEDVWKSSPRPYLQGQSDQDPGSVHAYCRSSPDYRWHLEIDDKELTTLLAFAGEAASSRRASPDAWRDVQRRGALIDFKVTSVAPSGWVREVRARFGSGDLVLTGYEFYLLWGRSSRWHELKSGFFTVSKQGAQYLFEGRGLGHGIGLCQWGAYGRAKAGFDYRSILSHYFPGSRVERMEL